MAEMSRSLSYTDLPDSLFEERLIPLAGRSSAISWRLFFTCFCICLIGQNHFCLSFYQALHRLKPALDLPASNSNNIIEMVEAGLDITLRLFKHASEFLKLLLHRSEDPPYLTALLLDRQRPETHLERVEQFCKS